MQGPLDFTAPVNLGNPDEFSVRELAELVIEATGSRSKMVFLPLPQDDPRQRQPDISLAKQHRRWSPTVQLHDGLQRTVAYFDGLLSQRAGRDVTTHANGASTASAPRCGVRDQACASMPIWIFELTGRIAGLTAGWSSAGAVGVPGPPSRPCD